MLQTIQPLAPQIRELRHSSRLLVRVLGLMDSRADGVRRSPAQCHVLTEVGAHGCLTTGELAEILEVDKSTASRAVNSLQRRGLLEVEDNPGDQRTKPVRLSAAGAESVSLLHTAADTQVGSALALLSEEERATVLRGVALYEQALHRAKALADVSFRPIQARDESEMARIIRSVMTEFGAVGRGFSIGDPEVDEMHRAYSADRCAYFVAERGGQLIAGGGIAPLRDSGGDDVCELRKMYALPEARGLGVGRGLLDRCLAMARESGFRTCYLETLEHMDRARALYEKLGFLALDGPMGDTGHYACNGWFALEL